MKFYQCCQHSYSISPITIKQLTWLSPIKTIMIWLTKQIKITKIVETFLRKLPWWCLVFINSKGNITEAGLQHWHFSWNFFFFSENPSCRAHGTVFFWSWDAFLVFDGTFILNFLSSRHSRKYPRLSQMLYLEQMH